MKRRTFQEIPSLLFKWFLALYLIHPVFYAASFALSIELADALRIFKVIGILAPLIIATFVIAFLLLNKRLAFHAKSLQENQSASGEAQRFINRYSLIASALVFTGCAGGPMLTVIIGIYYGVLVSIQQAIFFLLLGEFTAAIASAILFYVAKQQLYIFNNYISSFTPLSLFYKFSIPILSGIMAVLSFMALIIYNLTVNQTINLQSALLESRARETAGEINGFFNNIFTELNVYAKLPGIRNIDPGAMRATLVELHNSKGRNIEMLFASTEDGTAPNSFGSVKNISDRGYFKQVFKTGAQTVSEPVVNKATGTEIVVAATPLKIGEKTRGVIGATVLIKSIKEHLEKRNTDIGALSMILDANNKLVFHTDKSLIGKTISTNSEGTGNEAIHASFTKGRGLCKLAMGDKYYIAYRTTIPSTNQSFVLMLPLSSFYSKTNMLMTQIILSLIIISAVIFLVIFYISRSISVPIQNTIAIFKRVAKGDLTASSDDFVPDEFGELIKHLKLLLRSLREIAHMTIESSKQLATSSESLASTSQDLAQSAQGQAASVEQASASLEEISSSIENIAQSAKSQSDLATTANSSMEELRGIINRVSEYASEALAMANNSTREAQKGNELMQNAIRGMNNIDESTKKISEMVTLISDISDQVNLLALNAAIEAARAGEHGRGFAVVADEIGKLAEQTAMGAKDITQQVNTGLQEVIKGREYVDLTSKALLNIIENIRKTDELVNKITEASKAQLDASEKALADTRRVLQMADNISYATTEQMNTNREMVNTVNQINQLTQSVAAGAEEIASSSEEISAQAEGLKDQISFFKIQ